MLTWKTEGKYRAELKNYKDSEPVVVIRFDNHGDEVVISVSCDGVIKAPNSMNGYSNSHVRIASHGPLALSMKQYREIQTVISEARAVLLGIKRRGRVTHIGDGNKSLCGIEKDGKTWFASPISATCKTCTAVRIKKETLALPKVLQNWE